ncbi:MAG: purine-nucleoside phosphorylase [Candidatus Brocadiae bacterium]|nr:purine-nucleoside phosphorylase [Candidatus Brocadiia bacterium]
METIQEKIAQSVSSIQQKYHNPISLGVILGSGLGTFAEHLSNKTEIPYKDIAHFPLSTVQGHAGKLVLGEIEGKTLAVMSGRFHFYEGYNMQQVVYPIRVLGKLGIKSLIVTNAAGGINKSFVPGDLMLIDDHINLLGTNPLIGPNLDDFGPRFPDMTTAYTPSLKEKALAAAQTNDLPLKRGVYIAITGPSYETPSEIKMMRILGADAVGMSTVPEVIVARQMGINVLGISCITNMAAGILNQPLSHVEVFETAEKTKHKFVSLLKEIVKTI